MGKTVLVLGGARSGKSAVAEGLVEKHDKVAYIATAQPLDTEMRERIRRHRQHRPGHWRTFEQPLAVHDPRGAGAPEIETRHQILGGEYMPRGRKISILERGDVSPGRIEEIHDH